MGEINRRYFDGLLADHKLSLRALAARMGMGHSQLSLTFSGARKMTLDEAAQLSSIFSQPLHKIVEATGVSVQPVGARRVQVVGTMGGDGTVSRYGPEIIERTNAPENLPPETIAVQARTAGTPLEYMDGWVLFCRPPATGDTALFGSLCLAEIKGGSQVIGTLKRGYRDSSANISGPYNADSVALAWSTPVLLIRP